MQKYSPEQNMKFIMDTAKSLNFDGCFLVAKAKIESNLNNLATNGKYAGLFQLSDGIGGAKGNSRFDPVVSTKATITYINYNRNIVEPKLQKAGLKWENWMSYLCHQQGAGGFSAIVLNPNQAIETSSKKKAILNNLPKAARKTARTHADFIAYWKKRFNDLTNQCYNEMACMGYDTGLSSGACKLDMGEDIPSDYRKAKESQNNMFLLLGSFVASVLVLKAVK